MTFSAKLEALRRTNGYTQKYVAETIGVSAQAVSAYEKAISAPKIEVIYKGLANLFGVSVEFLKVDKATDEIVMADICQRKSKKRIIAKDCDVDRITAEIKGLKMAGQITSEDVIKIMTALISV